MNKKDVFICNTEIKTNSYVYFNWLNITIIIIITISCHKPDEWTVAAECSTAYLENGLQTKSGISSNIAETGRQVLFVKNVKTDRHNHFEHDRLIIICVFIVMTLTDKAF